MLAHLKRILQSFANRLALLFYRRADDPFLREWRFGGPFAVVLANSMLFSLLILSSLTLFFWLLHYDFSAWQDSDPQIVISRSDWKVLESDPGDCSKTSDQPSCPANVENDALWTSSAKRFDGRGMLKWRNKINFWVGVSFSPATAQRARELAANQLILGEIFGSADVWVNGSYVTSFISRDRSPLVLTLPIDVFSAPSGVKVAIRIQPRSAGLSDWFANPWKEGLATAAEASHFKNAASFWRLGAPLALFSVNILFSVIFFVFWLNNRVKQEYFYFSLFSAALSIKEVRLMDIFRGVFETGLVRYLDVWIYSLEIGMSLLLAIAFARGRRVVFEWGIPLTFTVPLIAQWVNEAGQFNYPLTTPLANWIVPSSYVFGGFVCFVQAVHLISNPASPSLMARLKLGISGRAFRLLAFATGMFAMASLYLLHFDSYASHVIIGCGHFVIVLLLSLTAIFEYRFEQMLLERSPLSSFHRMRTLPESVSGVVLSVDLRNSERLFRLEARRNEPGKYVATCLSHLWAAVVQQKGVVIESEGDGLIAMFNSAEIPNAMDAALRATDLMKQYLLSFETQLRDQSALTDIDLSIDFRAAICPGELKPIWRDIDSQKVAGWVESGANNAFVECARLLEIERQLGIDQRQSVVVISQTAVDQEQRRIGKWLLENIKSFDKHRNAYLVAVYLAAGIGSPVERAVQPAPPRVA